MKLTESPRNSYALIIGISKYTKAELRDLPSARIGAHDIADSFQELGYQTNVLLDDQATTDSINEAIDWLFTDRKPIDTLALYFSGHGFPVEKDVFLASSNFNSKLAQGLGNSGFRLSSLRDFYFQETVAQNVLVILDCCYSGGFSRTEKHHQSPEQLLGSLIRENLKGQPPARSMPFDNKVLIAATGKYQVSLDSDKTTYSPLVANLIPILRGDKAVIYQSVDSQGRITSSTLKSYFNNYFKVQQEYVLADYTFEDLQSGEGPGLVIADFTEKLHKESDDVIQKECREDWGEAVDVDAFFGRKQELAKLKQWMLQDRCRLLTIVGLGGVGKTSLAVKLIEQVKNDFDFIFWRSLRNAPPLDRILADCIKFLSLQRQIDLPSDIPGRISLLINYLKQSKCLLVLDNLEAILQSGNQVQSEGQSLDQQFRQGYEDYGRFIQFLGEVNHQGCLVITTREKPKGIDYLETLSARVRVLQLGGIDYQAGRHLLEDKGLVGGEDDWNDLVNRYSGNPLALKLVSETIRLSNNSQVRDFLAAGVSSVVPHIRDVLEEQFARLSDLEKALMYWLAIERELVSIETLLSNLSVREPKNKLYAAMESLSRRSLIEKGERASSFTQQPVVMEFVTEKFVERLSEEVVSREMDFLAKYAIMKAQSKEYLMNAQSRLILEPVLQNLLFMFRNVNNVENQLLRLLSVVRKTDAFMQGYAASNIFNLLYKLKGDVRGCDFSRLNFLQVSFQGVSLRDTDFTDANFESCAFTENFDSILCTEYSPKGDIVAAGGVDGAIRLWRTVDGKQQSRLVGHQSWIRSVSFSPKDALLASGSSDRTVRLWDLSNGQCICRFDGHEGEVLSVTFSPDGSKLISGGVDKIIRVWGIKSKTCITKLVGHEGSIWSVAVSPDGQVLASGAGDKTIRLWDLETGKLLRILTGHLNDVLSVTFGGTGTLLASGSIDKTIRIWDWQQGQQLHKLDEHSGRVWSVRFDSNASKLVSGSEDLTVRIWETKQWQCLRSLQGHSNWVRSVSYSPNSYHIVSGSEDQTVKIWEASNGECIRTFQGASNRVRSVAFSKDGSKIVNTSDDHTVRLWDVSTQECIRILHGHTNRVRFVRFNQDGSLVASASDDYTVKVWNLSNNQCIHTFKDHKNRVMVIAFSPNDQLLASGSEDRTVKLWRLSSGECLSTFSEFTDIVWSITFSPNGKYLATGADDGQVRIWDIASGNCTNVISGFGKVRVVEYNSTGDQIVVASADKTIKLLDLRDNRIITTFLGHEDWVRSVKFVQNDTKLISGGNDQIIRVWDASDGKCIKILSGHTSRIMSIDVNETCAMFVSASDDETMRLWHLDDYRCVAVLRNVRPYEKMKITNASGITDSQRSTLITLGAVE